MEPSRFETLKFALSAYNDANKQANQMWAAAALLAIFVFTARYNSENTSVLGIKLGSEFVLPAAVIVLSGLNIAYAVAHVSVYRIAAVYQSIIRQHFGKELPVTDEFSWHDLAQRAPISNFNRLYPLFVPIERHVGQWFYIIVKRVFDLTFCGLPAFAIVYGLVTMPNDAPLFGLAIFLSALSLLSTSFLMRWIFKWPEYWASRGQGRE